ncbi:MAG: PIG-L family deacetylase [Clostridiaceae bacterium]|nr:PIG-L family deacetylase [Clostridiaceae bacterium]
MKKGQTMLLLGVYGMEVVECGGVLAKNVEAGGTSYASIMLAGERMRPQATAAAEILGVKLGFTDFTSGEVEVVPEAKKKLIRVIREYKPDIIITQDPEHCFHDLDPDRRLAMILILESIALAARNYALEEMPGLDPHPIPTIYYMTPENPNCVVEVAGVWEKKEKAMDELKSQMEFSGKHYEQYYGNETMAKLVKGWNLLDNYYAKGREAHKEIDKSLHVYHGAGGHGRFALAEAYRREGKFHLENLMA